MTCKQSCLNEITNLSIYFLVFFHPIHKLTILQSTKLNNKVYKLESYM